MNELTRLPTVIASDKADHEFTKKDDRDGEINSTDPQLLLNSHIGDDLEYEKSCTDGSEKNNEDLGANVTPEVLSIW